MEECATCHCGNQTWKIYQNRIVCAKCECEYWDCDIYINPLESIVDYVNDRRDEN